MQKAEHNDVYTSQEIERHREERDAFLAQSKKSMSNIIARYL